LIREIIIQHRVRERKRKMTRRFLHVSGDTYLLPNHSLSPAHPDCVGRRLHRAVPPSHPIITSLVIAPLDTDLGRLQQ
jgi:hypothetical protein